MIRTCRADLIGMGVMNRVVLRPLVVVRTAAMVGAITAMPACGGSMRPPATPVTSDQVRQAFGAEHVALHVVVDSRTLDQQKIDRMTRVAATDVGAIRAAKLADRKWLEVMRARAASDPLIWLTTGSNTVDVMVWSRTSDATVQFTSAIRGWHRLGGTTGDPGFARVRNVFVVYGSQLDRVTLGRMRTAINKLKVR